MRKFTLFIAAFFFIGMQSVFAQKLVSGTVKSAEDGLGIIGATVVVPGTTIGTTTDASGAFTLNVPTDAQSLSFSYVGMKTVELSIGTQTVFNVTLEPDVMALQDVIVTAFGISRQTKSLTYAAQSVTTDALTEARNPNVMSGLSGKVSGMLITQTGQGVGGSTKVLLRGNRSISGSSQPIYVVDGITLNGGIENISPDEIESISVLKGANAAALYGSRANNGAIVVTTKSGKGARQGGCHNQSRLHLPGKSGHDPAEGSEYLRAGCKRSVCKSSNSGMGPEDGRTDGRPLVKRSLLLHVWETISFLASA